MMNIPNSLKAYVRYGLKDESVDILENELGYSLPLEFRQFLKLTNGMSIEGGALIYGSDDLVERNETWEVRHYAPGFVAIGDDGGGNVFLMESDSQDLGVFVVGSGVMDPNFMRKVSQSMSEWLRNGLPNKRT